ncbi:glycoside hydrolase family 16 protein [Dothidotthia symphoricarpi CBS 119687]|uniref:Glycoside hydrolase family 16 protein n=1 Tax=Dothidotthia symphoricarpi CBS 119687 TaxID=1392245 RepID=A0A6A6ARZ3_9PLEO|nr:glycoside hydrolase family 16 protein [Dothidotthia symphoricarpi CBS 119687]KAF2133617.1 glycoside hydrolase family 16 protein [Dothidotthia symphoricarpi CBS 119687]
MFSKTLAFLSTGLALVSAAPPAITGYSLTWSDDFTGAAGSLPDSSNWIVDTGTSYPGGPANWGTGEVQTYTNRAANIKQNGSGVLQITAVRNTAGAWTSGRIETKRTDFQAVAGKKMRISARLSMPNVSGDAAAGYWPAFWTLGAEFRGNYKNWPSIGEYDIMENVNGLDKAWGVLHCGTNPGGACNEPNGIGSTSSCSGSSCKGYYHTYSIDVDRSSSPEKLTWSVDGVAYQTVTKTQLGATAWAATVQHGHFLLLNLAMGGAFPNAVQGSATPTSKTVSGYSLWVDWVAVYNSK